MRRKGLGPLVFILVVVTAGMVATLAAGNSPLLGLDLQGGVSLVLQPTRDVEGEELDQAIEIIRTRVDAIGVAEPEITRQGGTVLVQLPGVDEQERALELVGQTAELRFRPVLAVLPPVGQEVVDPLLVPEDPTDTSVPDASVPDASVPDTGDDETGAPSVGLAPGEFAGVAQTPDTTAGQSTQTTTTLPPVPEPQPAGVCPLVDELDLNDDGVTPVENDNPEDCVVLPELGDDGEIVARYFLGPTALTGEALQGADAVLGQVGLAEWTVDVVFRGGEDGIDLFNQVALLCNVGDVTACPTGQLAIVLDGLVVSAPTIQQPVFERDQIQISGSFGDREAKDLALVLRYGALPVELEPQQTQTVSATLGGDALDAGVVAGLIGLGLVAVFMLAYYRLLGLVAILSLALSAAMLWVIIAYLGESRGLALTLAGVTGIIVAIGVSIDSNVVYFEHLKEDMRNGRTLRSSVERSFVSAFSTIVKADLATLLAAAILYWLTIGPVRGFALYLGLATLLDLVASWFFMRPVVILMGHSRWLGARPALLGVPAEPTRVAPVT